MESPLQLLKVIVIPLRNQSASEDGLSHQLPPLFYLIPISTHSLIRDLIPLSTLDKRQNLIKIFLDVYSKQAYPNLVCFSFMSLKTQVMRKICFMCLIYKKKTSSHYTSK